MLSLLISLRRSKTETPATVPIKLYVKSHPVFIQPPPTTFIASFIPAMLSPAPNINAPSPKPSVKNPINSISSTSAPSPIVISVVQSIVPNFPIFLSSTLKNSIANPKHPKKCVRWSYCIGPGLLP